MLLEVPAVEPTRKPRRWYPPDRVVVPPEPGRLVTNALINVARRARGCRTRGDDRIETRGYAVKRLLWRWGARERSGHYACSIAQLVAGLAPAMGWGNPPPTRAERERWVRAHRKSVQRWLDELQAAGVIAYEGERDNRGQLWRTLITLRAAPAPPAHELQLARRRLRRFRYRAERRRRARLRRQRRASRRRPLMAPERVLEAARKPQRATRARHARQRAFCVHEHRRLLARQRGDAHMKDLTHPFGAPPTAEYLPLQLETPTTLRNAASKPSTPTQPPPTPARAAALVERPGARARESATAPHDAQTATTSYRENDADRPGGTRGAAPSEAQRAGAPGDAVVIDGPASLELPSAIEIDRRIAARYAATAWRREAAARQAAARARALVAEPPGRFPGLGRLRAAWVVFRHGAQVRPGFTTPESGAERLGDHGSTDAGAARAGQLRRAAAAIALYEQHAAHRPPGWPEAGAAALCALATQRIGRDFEHDVARLRRLAKDMRALGEHADAEHVARARRRAERRWDQTTPTRIPFRTLRHPAQRPRFETAEGRRRRIRDLLLMLNEHPGLSANVFLASWHAYKRHEALGDRNPGDPAEYALPDGLTARAQRYQREIAAGRWNLPTDWRTGCPG